MNFLSQFHLLTTYPAQREREFIFVNGSSVCGGSTQTSLSDIFTYVFECKVCVANRDHEIFRHHFI